MMKELKDLKDANKALQDQLKAVSHTFCNYSYILPCLFKLCFAVLTDI